MSYRDDFEEPQDDWDDAIDFGDVTETGSNVSDVRIGLDFFSFCLVLLSSAHILFRLLF